MHLDIESLHNLSMEKCEGLQSSIVDETSWKSTRTIPVLALESWLSRHGPQTHEGGFMMGLDEVRSMVVYQSLSLIQKQFFIR